jgi:sporulation related protein
MTGMNDRGPEGLPMFNLVSPLAEIALGRVLFDDACSRLPDVFTFVDEHFTGPDAPQLCVVLDEPAHTRTRGAAVLAIAAELSARGRKVVVVDGDDHLPDLTRWSGLLEHEGWIDVVRYDLSLEAASMELPFGEGAARLLGVGSYQPTRANVEELKHLVEILSESVDHVIVCASTGDRGAVWAALPSLRVLCWDRAVQRTEAVENMIRDAGLLGEEPKAVLVYGVEDPAAMEGRRYQFNLSEDEPEAASSPVFRRMAILMGVLVVVLAAWWIGQTDWSGRSSDDVAAGDDVVVVLDSTAADRDVSETESGGLPYQDDHETIPENVPVTTADGATEAVGTNAAAVVAGVSNNEPDLVAEQAAEQAAVAEQTVPETPTVDHFDDHFKADPFTADVGAGGWCLWVYSLADSSLAVEELERMAGRGFHAEMRSIEAKDHLWFRIYTGSFASHGEASAAMNDLNARLETDWALPQRARVLR